MDRWPPVYDEAELAATIQLLRDTPGLAKWLYGPREPRQPDFCQGDVLRLASFLPLIGEDGRPAAEARPQHLWQVLGNSCDLDRTVEEVAWTQVIPLRRLDSEHEKADAASYRSSRIFFLPALDDSAPFGHVADFLRPATIDRRALRRAELVARLSWKGWLCFHACLVRYLARGDGRNDRPPR